MGELSQKLEALLFTAGEAVLRSELAALLRISDEELQGAIEDLRAVLTNRGIALVETETEVALTTHPALAEFLTQFLGQTEAQLSRATSETLALVAYRGPVTRYELDVLRGVDTRRILRQLVQNGWVTKASAAGRAPLYDITPEFLKQLGITRKQELPAFAELSDQAAAGELLKHTPPQE